jgi:hypothetical protein
MACLQEYLQRELRPSRQHKTIFRARGKEQNRPNAQARCYARLGGFGGERRFSYFALPSGPVTANPLPVRGRSKGLQLDTERCIFAGREVDHRG